MSTTSTKKKPLSEKEIRFYSEVGRRISQLRKGIGMTQKHLGEKIGVGQVTIARIEAGAHRYMLSTYADICAALGIEPSELLVGLNESLNSTKPQVDEKLLERMMKAALQVAIKERS